MAEFQSQETRLSLLDNGQPTPETFRWFKSTDRRLGNLEALPVNTKTASHVLVRSDAGSVIEMNVGSGNTLTVPPDADVPFRTGSVVRVSQVGAGQTTLTPGSGVTIQSRIGLKLAGQYAHGLLYKRAANLWLASGDLTT